jgi:hypothetical protein
MTNSSNNWFEKSHEYVGEGRAEFANPNIILEGPVRIQYKESGESDIQMDYRNVRGEVDSGILELINRNVSVSEYRQILEFVNQIENNQCTKLEVITPSGIFSSIGIDIKHYIPNHLNSTLKFFILTSEFEVKDKRAKYWIIPLYNFLTHFNKYPLEWTHPLSINNKHIGILFKFNCNSCFIEPLDDYEIRKDELINLQSPKKLTSLMVGELRSNPIDFEFLDQQVPIDFLELLGLATGTEIGSPWIEFRTADGDLVKRIHAEFNNPIYFKGHVAIDEFWDPGISTLLARSQSLLHLGNSYMFATLKHLVRAGSRNLTTEEKLTHLFQALDCLCETFDLKTQHLNQRLNTNQQMKIKEILKKARMDIMAISSTATIDEQSQAIKEIANRTSSNPAATTRDFGLSLSDLLKLFDLPDLILIENYYQTSKSGKSWIRYISHCRGVVMHKGFLDFYGDEFDPKEINIIRSHLHDILLRLIFKMLNYDGIYQSPTGPLPNRNEANWVKPITSPDKLGY